VVVSLHFNEAWMAGCQTKTSEGWSQSFVDFLWLVFDRKNSFFWVASLFSDDPNIPPKWWYIYTATCRKSGFCADLCAVTARTTSDFTLKFVSLLCRIMCFEFSVYISHVLQVKVKYYMKLISMR
jgi:hypothetical protein